MQNRYNLFLLILLVLTACSMAKNVNFIERGEFDKVSGWIFFNKNSNGMSEFRIYARKKDFGDVQDVECISGAFPLKLNRKYSLIYNGKRVRVSGKFISSHDIGVNSTSFFYHDVLIENYCFGNYILLADEIESIE